MARIRILPEILTNKIAAGEVVERPSSVLKELLENSLDAQSTRIVVDIRKGGRTLIQVADNGEGMEHDDALLSLERYATSKIYSDDDLFAINTLGFRGEALPSIASVSRTTVVSRKRDNTVGTQVKINGGKIVSVTEAGAPPGTLISVADLFYNTPARRKFLKSVNTEMGHIADTMAAMALGWPSVGFELSHNGRKIFSWPAARDTFSRVVDILGKEVAPGLITLHHESPAVSLEGYLALPEFTRSTRRGLHLFVNGRLVKDKLATHALLEGYHGRLMKGRYPVAVLFISVPPDQVDVNVHPAKAEVRFVDSKNIHGAIVQSVQDNLDSLDRVPWKTKAPAPSEATDIRPVATDMLVQPPSQETFGSYLKQEPTWSRAGTAHRHTPKLIPPPTFHPVNETPPQGGQRIAAIPNTPETASEPEGLKALAQFADSYVLCQSSQGLLIIDQHAAHERILFEQFKHFQEEGGVEVQNLLLPETFELSHTETEILLRILPDLKKMGFDVDSFSGRTFVVKAVPAVLADRECKGLVTEIVEKVAEAGGEARLSDALDESLMVMACHGAVRAHQTLSLPEMDALLAQLEACKRPSQCPHGRPTWVLWTESDLERIFKRK